MTAKLNENRTEVFTFDVPFFKDYDVFELVERYKPKTLEKFLPYLEKTNGEWLFSVDDEGIVENVQAEAYLELLDERLKQAIPSWRGFNKLEYEVTHSSSRGYVTRLETTATIDENIISEMNTFLGYDKIGTPLSFDEDETEFDTALTKTIQTLLGDDEYNLNNQAARMAADEIVKFINVENFTDALKEAGVVLKPELKSMNDLPFYKEENLKDEDNNVVFSVDPSETNGQLKMKLENHKKGTNMTERKLCMKSRAELDEIKKQQASKKASVNEDYATEKELLPIIREVLKGKTQPLSWRAEMGLVVKKLTEKNIIAHDDDLQLLVKEEIKKLPYHESKINEISDETAMVAYNKRVRNVKNALKNFKTTDTKVGKLLNTIDSAEKRPDVEKALVNREKRAEEFDVANKKMARMHDLYAKRQARKIGESKINEEKIQPSEIYDLAVTNLPAEDIDHHQSDLYIRKTPESTALIKQMGDQAMLSTFRDNIDGDTWYDLPFCYKPHWAKSESKINEEYGDSNALALAQFCEVEPSAVEYLGTDYDDMLTYNVTKDGKTYTYTISSDESEIKQAVEDSLENLYDDMGFDEFADNVLPYLGGIDTFLTNCFLEDEDGNDEDADAETVVGYAGGDKNFIEAHCTLDFEAIADECILSYGAGHELARYDSYTQEEEYDGVTYYIFLQEVRDINENYKGKKTMKRKMNEDAKIIASLYDDFKPWSGAVATWEKITDADKLDDLDRLIEELYPDGIGMTELNDLLWFEDEWVLEQLGLAETEVEESLKPSRRINEYKTKQLNGKWVLADDEGFILTSDKFDTQEEAEAKIKEWEEEDRAKTKKGGYPVTNAFAPKRVIESKMNENEEIDATWDYLVSYGIATQEELSLVTTINGYTIEALNDVIYARTGMRDLEQLKHEYGEDMEESLKSVNEISDELADKVKSQRQKDYRKANRDFSKVASEVDTNTPEGLRKWNKATLDWGRAYEKKEKNKALNKARRKAQSESLADTILREAHNVLSMSESSEAGDMTTWQFSARGFSKAGLNKQSCFGSNNVRCVIHENVDGKLVGTATVDYYMNEEQVREALVNALRENGFRTTTISELKNLY